MKIGVDCHVLAGKFQGSRTYLVNLYREILRFDKNNEYLFFGHWQDERPFGPESRHIDYKSFSRLNRLIHGTGRLIKQYDIELFHSTYISPLLIPCKQLLTIHDILFETHPQYFTRFFVKRSRLLVRLSAKRATQIHTISEFTKKALIDIYGIEPEKIKLVSVGIDPVQFNSSNRDEAVRRVADSTGLKDYILTVGRLEPRKNHLNLLKAYNIFRDRHHATAPLLIVGQSDFNYSDIFNYVERNNMSDCVHFLDTVGDQLLADIYKAAKLFVYPSFAEGFGIPILEAMACGVPVITSNCTAMPEIAQNNSLLVDPTDIKMISEAMCSLYKDTDLRLKLSGAGLLQAELWTWKRMAQAYLEAIKTIK